MGQITTLGFDADDTLWHNETFFRLTEERFVDLLSDHAETDRLKDRLLEAERRNIHHYGFGVKGFTLSMIETAIEVTEGKVPSDVISQILSAGREMLSPFVLISGCFNCNLLYYSLGYGFFSVLLFYIRIQYKYIRSIRISIEYCSVKLNDNEMTFFQI